MKKVIVMFSLITISVINVFSQIPTDSLKAAYLFNGNANDESGNGFNGVVVGASLTTDRFNNDNSAYFFDGVNDHISLPSDFDYQNRTICAWFNASSITTYNRIYDSNHAGLNYGGTTLLTHERDGVDKMRMTYWEVDGGYEWNTCINSWNFMAVSIVGNEIKYYINGLYAGSYSGIYKVPVDGDSHAYIGTSRTAINRFFHGKIDDVRVYSKALNQNEIIALYAEEYANTIYYDSIQVTDTLLIDVALGVDNPSIKTQIKVYPNPSSDYINIDFGEYDQLSNYRLKIFNIQQTEVYSQRITSKFSTIQINEIGTKGLYFIKILDDSNDVVSVKKLIIN
jgi:hypothetical protein